MERLSSSFALLKLLHCQLQRQWTYLERGQVDLAVRYSVTLSRTLRRLEETPVPRQSGEIRRLFLECSELNDSIQERLERESKDLAREHFQSVVDLEIHKFLKNS